jgi:hypothetical protein
LDVIWTLVECSVKRVEHCTAIIGMLTVLLPIMYVRGIEICVVDQQMLTANICLSYIIKCFDRYCYHLQVQNPMDSLHTSGHGSVFMYIVFLST